MALRLSFTNLIESTAASILAASHQTSNFCSSQAQQPQRPFLPWRAPTTSTADLIIDLGSSQTVGVIAVINANFASASLQGASSSGGIFAAPTCGSYNEAVTITQDPWSGRYQHVHYSTGFGYRYVRLKIPGQSPVDGATSTYYALGGLWAGTLSTTPDHFAVSPTIQIMLPREDAQPSHGGWRQRSQLGDPQVQIDAVLKSQTCGGSPANTDDLDTWRSLERSMWTADYFLLALNLGDLAQTWIARSLDDPQWTVSPGVSEGRLTLEEVTGP